MKGTIGEKMKRRLELFLIIFLPILGVVFLGGKIMNLTKRPEQKITTTSSKKVVEKSKEEIKKEQIAFLKEHEQEMTVYVKAHNANIHQVSYDWASIKTLVGGNGTPQGGDEILLVYGYANGSDLTNFSLNFTLDENKMPKIDSIGSDSLYRVEKK